LAALSACHDSLGQQTKQQTIEESELGWHKVYHYKGARENQKLDDRVFTIAQLSVMDTLANWMQASYLPKGGIGDIKRNFFPKASPYSPYNLAWPQGYGATAWTWDVTYNKEGKLVHIQETETPWDISANAVPGWPIRDICTPNAYYFTMPSFEGHDDVKKMQDLSGVAQLKPYITFWMRDLSGGGGTEYVLLCKDNKSPFLKVAKGAYLQSLEAAIPREYQAERKSIYEKNKGDQRSIDYFMKYLDEKQAKRLAALKANKEKYRNRLTEPAEVVHAQPDIQLENNPDVFEGNGSNSFKYPVYTIDPDMYELCKKDKPQWILVSWNWRASSPKEKHMHESIINNFNFAYTYNFFFAPEKVKGKPYTPLRPPYQKEAVVVTEKSVVSKNAALDKNVYYFEDFSSSELGEKPNGWYARASGTGVSSEVTTVAGAPGKWAEVAGNALIPNNLTKPLPQNFSLSYDLIVPENFTWGAKGLVLMVANEKTEGTPEFFISLRIRPGSGTGDGELTLETKFPSGYLTGTKWYTAKGFSNNRAINRITTTIRKNGETLQLLIDDTMVVQYDKCMPGNQQFNSVSFTMGRSDGATEKFYISNIKVTKE
jgi:hypothetical protein